MLGTEALRPESYTEALQYVKSRIHLCLLRRLSIESLTMAKRKNPHAVALGRIGGRKSGKARMEKLTPERRSEIARNAVQARWAKKKNGVDNG